MRMPSGLKPLSVKGAGKRRRGSECRGKGGCFVSETSLLKKRATFARELAARARPFVD